MKALSLILSLSFLTHGAFGGERDEKVNKERAALEGGELWVYNDLERGFAKARESGKPLLVVYRCIP